MSKNINGLEIENIYIIKDGVVVLTTNYKNNNIDGVAFCFLADNIENIEKSFKKATSKTKDKYIKNNQSFYISTNKRDYINNILYDLYIADDVATIEQLDDYISKSGRCGVIDYQKQYKLTFKCNVNYKISEWVSITKEEAEKLEELYFSRGWYDARFNLLKHSFDYIIKEAEEEIKQGFYTSHYTKVNKTTREITFKGYIYKHDKSEEALENEKITDIMKNKAGLNNISVYDVERIKKYFDIKIK